MTAALLAAAHGTRSVAGAATVRALVEAIRDQRRGLEVELCFLDVLRPTLAEQLATMPGPVVVAPVLLSGGYHVRDDIPGVAGARARVAGHLGPDPMITRALTERLESAGGLDADHVALVGSPSSRESAVRDLADAAADLSGALSRAVHPLPIDDALAHALAALPGRVAVASYLLSEGFFFDTLHAAAATAGITAVTEPLGRHPAIASLVLQRYDDSVAPS
jgi:sirohydrochlorin ferrochelatase